MAGSETLSPQAQMTPTLLTQVYRDVLKQLDSATSLQERLRSEQTSPFTQLLAIGKAAPSMAASASPFLAAPREGFVLTKEAHLGSRYQESLWGIECWEAGHPVPDQRGLLATSRLLEWLEEIRNPGHLLLLISGGASSLVVDPSPPLTLADLRDINTALLASGMPIENINVLRKHLSALKGGGLGQALQRFRRVTQLVFSDICPQSDRLDLVGSGLALADPSTKVEAEAVLAKLQGHLLPQVWNRCQQALHETVKSLPYSAEGLADYRTLSTLAKQALNGHAKEAAGWCETVTGDVEQLAQRWAHLARRLRSEGFSGVLVASGEPTVRLTNVLANASGGRCQELAVLFAREIAGVRGIALLAGSSDGTDGPTPYAGACVDGRSWESLVAVHGEPPASRLLEGHDVSRLLRASPELLLDTGPTGHNLNDLYLLAIDPS